MANIIITRENQILNQGRLFKIFIDDVQVGTIANGESKAFPTTPGEHRIKAKIDWGGSQTCTVQVGNDDQKELKLREKKQLFFFLIFTPLLFILSRYLLANQLDAKTSLYIGIAIYLLPFIYSITLGRNKYLALKEAETTHSTQN